MMTHKLIKLISSDKVTFEVEEKIAIVSNTLKTFINPEYPFIQSETKTIELPIESRILKRIIEFMYYKANAKNIGEFKITDEETLDLLDVSAYLRL